jgi:hypothetical protein
MKRILIMVILGMTILDCSKKEKLGQAEISEINSYEKLDLYFPHDCKTEFDLVDKIFELKKDGENIIINNNANNGYTGHQISLKLNTKLEIIKAEYSEWTDAIDESETTYKVDSVDLIMNSNPFNSQKIVGKYTLYLTGNYIANELEAYGKEDEIFKRDFRAKFRTCEK